MIEILATIETPANADEPFCGSVVLWYDRVVEAHDVIKYMRKWTRERVRDHCIKNGWTITVVHQLERTNPW
jgi:hypothetical protein